MLRKNDALHPGVTGKSQKTLLGHPAEKEQTSRLAGEPLFRDGVMLVSSEGQSNPDVDVKQKHHRFPKARRCGRWSNRGFPVCPRGPGGIVLVPPNQPSPPPPHWDMRPSPQHPRADVVPPRGRRRRYALDLEFPCSRPPWISPGGTTVDAALSTNIRCSFRLWTTVESAMFRSCSVCSTRKGTRPSCPKGFWNGE